MQTEAQLYRRGWAACMAGVDGRYTPEGLTKPQRYAFTHGWLDAMDASDDEEPEPQCAGYRED